MPPKIREIPLSGRLRTAVDPVTISPNDFRQLTNLRYTDTTVRGIQGHTKVNTTVLNALPIRNGIHFRKDQPSESHVIVDADLNCYQNVTPIPSDGDFVDSEIYDDPSGATTGRYAIAPTGMLARCNGKEALLFGGAEYRCAGFIDIPVAGSVYNYTDIVNNTLTDVDNLATLATNHVDANYIVTFYVGSVMPIKGVKFYVTTGSGVSSTMTAKYWSGTAWVAVSNPSDGTSGFQTTGGNWFTFDSTSSVAKHNSIEKQMAYWYQFTVTATSNYNKVIKISHVTVSVPMQKIQDLWDGEGRPCAAFILNQNGVDGENWDFTTNVFTPFYDPWEYSHEAIVWPDFKSFVPIHTGILSASGYLLFGFAEQVSGVMLYFPSSHINNTAATIDSLDYWDGTQWVSLLTTMTDDTLDSTGTKTMAHTGWVTWAPPALNVEMPQTGLPGNQQVIPKNGTDPTTITNEYALYYYRMSFSATLAGNHLYYVRGIPAQTKITGYTFADQYAGRLMLCDNVDGKRNSARYSSYQTCNVLNGKDSDVLEFGGDEELVASAALYNRYGSTETNTWVVCKKNETWVLSGSNPDKWEKFPVSLKYGCIAPLSMTPINLSPKESTQQVSYNAAVWVSTRGVEVFSGGSMGTVSDDICDLFDPSRSTYLGADVIPTITGFPDYLRNEWHMVVPGVTEWVWDWKRNKWFQIDRVVPLYGGFPVSDTNGYQYCYGYGNNGFVYRLENGTDFDESDIVHTIQTADIALEGNFFSKQTFIRALGFVQVAKNNTANSVTITHYGDTKNTGNILGTISPASAYGRLLIGADPTKARMIAGRYGPHSFHSIKASLTTNNETCGFEPIFLAFEYEDVTTGG